MGSCTNSSNIKRREKITQVNNNKSENKIKDNNDTNNQQKDINSINYYLLCPNCLKCSPHIEKFYYDETSKNFLVRYTCICHENTMHSKESLLLNILSDKEPENECNIHKGNKLINFCRTCRKSLCKFCKEGLHKGHNIEEENLEKIISKEDADNMLKIIKEKEQKFNDEIELNERKME